MILLAAIARNRHRYLTRESRTEADRNEAKTPPSCNRALRGYRRCEQFCSGIYDFRLGNRHLDSGHSSDADFTQKAGRKAKSR
jgi:hypothetical protein